MADNSVSWRIFALTLWEPWYMMYLTLTLLPSTVRDIIHHGETNKPLDWSAFKNAWFAAVWAIFGPMFAEGGSSVVGPLMAKAKGVVLDIGPGAGDWVHLFKAEKEGKTGITKIYGVEPNTALHARLREKVKVAGLEDVYEIVAIGAQDLGTSGLSIERESIDTVVTVQSICSVSQPKVLVKELYEYLKPGGTWIMWEHVRTHETGWIRWYQALVNLFWPHFFHGCSLTRSTDEMIMHVGDWEHVEMNMPGGQNRYMPCPGMLGDRKSVV